MEKELNAGELILGVHQALEEIAKENSQSCSNSEKDTPIQSINYANPELLTKSNFINVQTDSDGFEFVVLIKNICKYEDRFWGICLKISSRTEPLYKNSIFESNTLKIFKV